MTVAARTLSRGLAEVVAELELRQSKLVTLEEIEAYARASGARTSAKVVAARLREAGWLLSTGRRGVYEFAPGAHAGPFGHGDPFTLLRADLLAGGAAATVALQSSLWLHGLAERAPDRHELAVAPGVRLRGAITRRMRVVHFSAALPAVAIDDLPAHRPATVLVHAAAKPRDVRGWSDIAGALPDLGERCAADELERELQGRPDTVRARVAYLLSGVAPTLAAQLLPDPPEAVTWFGHERISKRFDKRFNVADSLLPFDPRVLTR